MRYRRLQTLGFAALLATITAIHCLPTEAQADRRRRWTTYGSDRGRLVVACDMRSDTCSDGRKIATTRSTPVPCETSPGVWEMVPEDTACISRRGLESWASTTSYLSWGAELNRSPWFTGGAAGHSVSIDRTGGTNLMCQNAELGPDSPAGRGQTTTIPTTAGPQTLACVARPNTGLRIRLNPGVADLAKVFPMEDTWDRYAHTIDVEEGQGSTISVYTLGQTCIDIAACWFVKADTPGRACWGGEAPVTCAADQHTISTDGWPVVAGEVSFIYTPGTFDDGTKYLVSASTFQSVGWEVYVRFGSALAFLSHADGSTRIVESDPLTWEARPYHIRVRWREGEVVFWRDGVEVGRTSLSLVPAGPLPSTAGIGLRSSGASGWINGSIRSLTVRSYEEVSP